MQGWLRFFLSIENWSVFEAFGVLPGVWYLTISGLFTGIIYLMAAAFALINTRKLKRLSAILLLVGLAGYWFDRLFAVISPEARTSLPFTLVSSLVFTFTAVGILYWDTILARTTLQDK
jgi:hypothetical protein